jgi:prephenate dehydrogenase
MDKPEFSLHQANIAIIGLGLMGGSLALSLKSRCRHLSALDLDQATLDLARRQEIVHCADSDPAKILVDADLVILACPIPGIVDWLAQLPAYIQQACIILDIGSTKREIVAAFEKLPPNFDPIGGHPICGRERLSLENAERFLFRDAPFVLTPLNRTSPLARSAALELVAVLGSKPIWMNADEHDRILASTSHLPYLLSSALALVTPAESSPLIGPGFLSTSRLAGTPSSMMFGVIRSNRDNVLAALNQLQDQLSIIESALSTEDLSSLQKTINNAGVQYDLLLSNK